MRKALASLIYSFLFIGGTVALAPNGQAQTSSGSEQMKPGLATCYMYDFVRHIDELDGWDIDNKCKPGAPLAKLDSRVGDGKVLTSDATDGVMAKISGFIHLEKPGSYAFTFESNDGFRLEIDGELIVEDPDVHGDRYSGIGRMEVTEAGWYPLKIYYFERRNTSTLRFFWRPPGVEGTFPVVPANVLAH